MNVAHLALSLLGAFEATLDGVAITTFESARVRALLAYLAVEADRPHSREALAGLLWPDQPERGAHNNLRAALANLRTALHDRQAQPPFLLISRAAIQFNAACDHQLDVNEFRSTIDDTSTTLSAGLRLSGAPHTQPSYAPPEWTESQIENLKSVIALYRGPFLHGFSVNSIEFEAWLLLRQEQLECQFLTALQRLAALHEARGEYELAQANARRQLEWVPWDEPAHRRLMRLLALTGRRGAALAQYGTCRRVLTAEFGVEPATETTALYERIREGKVPQQIETDKRTKVRPSVYPLESAAVFVARKRELAALNSHLEQALAGRGRIVLVSGEAGSGKTALLTEFARQATAAHSDLVVAGGHGSERLGQGDPYLPFREILQLLAGDVAAQQAGQAIPREQALRLWDLLPVTVQALLAEGPDLVDRLVPGAALALRAEAFAPGGAAWRIPLDELVEERSRIGLAEQAVPPQSSAALLEQVTRVLRAIAHRRPLILLLDDLQWADAGSLSQLFHLGRHLAQAGSRLLLVGAYRPHDLLPASDGAPPPLLPVIHELQRDFGEIGIDLDRAGGRPFVDAWLDAEPNALGEPFRTQLNRVTGGHALFTVELVREMREHGDLTCDEAGRWVEGPALDWGRLPARVEAVIAGRLDRLPANRLALLTAASVEGETFTAEVLSRTLGLDEAEVLHQLNGSLSHAYLVRAQGLERLDNGQRLSRYQFRHALFQAYLYGRLNAVERARQHEAVGAALEMLHQGHEAGLAALAPQLAWHFQAAGLADKAADYLLRAGRRAHWLSAAQEAISLYRRGLALLATRPESDEASAELSRARARRELDLQLALNSALLDVSEWGALEQTAALDRAYQLGQHLGEPARLLPTLQALSKLGMAQGKHEQALAFAQQLLDLAEQSQEPTHVILGHHLIGTSWLGMGNLGVARAHLEQALVLYRHQAAAAPGPSLTPDPDLGVSVLVWLPYTLWLLGYPAQALARSREAVALAKLALAPSLALTLNIAGAGCHIFRREVQAVRDCTEQLQRLVIEKNVVAYQPWVDFYQGWLLVNQGQPDEAFPEPSALGASARRLVEGGLAQMRASTSAVLAFRPYRLTLLAGACLLAGQVEAGSQTLDEALALVEQTNARSNEAEMHRLRGEMLRLRAEAEVEVESCFRKAIEVAQRQEAKSWELRATTSLARLWQRQGRTEEARSLLADVYGWFTEGFDTPDLVEARALLAALERKAPGSDGLLFAGAT
jgi:DNA-binding SARP family transcriptional activator